MPVSQTQRSLLSNALIEPQQFYAEGVWSFPADVMRVFILGESRPVPLNMGAPSVLDFERLARVCQSPAFGVNQAEGTRRNGLDRSKFACNINVFSSGLLQRVHAALFGWDDHTRPIEAELSKLNVYGPGSSSKPRVDTPTDDDVMFGYLVLVFPTPHEGGQLVLRHDGKETVHDASSSATANRYSSPDQVSWIAFHNDVEHEVLPVVDGYRVALTFNLFYVDDERLRTYVVPQMRFEPLLAAFKHLLADLSFFPDGGRLGFALKHKYRVPDVEQWNEYGNLLERVGLDFKGSDRALLTAANAAGLAPRLRLVYNLQEHGTWLMDRPVYKGTSLEDTNWDELMRAAKAEKIEQGPSGENEHEPEYQVSPSVSRRRRSAGSTAPDLRWISPYASTQTRIESSYIAHRSKAFMGSALGDLVVITSIPSKENRAVC